MRIGRWILALTALLAGTVTSNAHALDRIDFTPRIKARAMAREAKLCSRLLTDDGSGIFVPDGLPSPHKMTPEEVAVWADALTDRGSRYGDFIARVKSALRLAGTWDKRMKVIRKKVTPMFERYAHEWVPSTALLHAEAGLLDLDGRIVGLVFSPKSFAEFVAAGGGRDFARMGYSHLQIKSGEPHLSWKEIGDLSHWHTLTHVEIYATLQNIMLGRRDGQRDAAESLLLASNPSLMSLKLAAMEVGPEMARKIAENTNLKEVDIGYALLGDEAFGRLFESRSIEKLAIRCGQYGDAVFNTLPLNSIIKSLTLSDDSLGVEFVEWLIKKSSVVELELGLGALNRTHAEWLGRNLASRPSSLRRLKLRNSYAIGSQGFKALLIETPLTHVELDPAYVLPKELKWLAVEKNTNLTHLGQQLLKIQPKLKERFQEWSP